MSSFRQGILAAALALLTAGCSTVATLIGAWNPERYDCSDGRFVPRVYSGIFNDLAILRSDAVDQGIVFWDLPFSLLADTLVLPYTLYAQIRYGNLCPNPEQSAHEAEPPQ